MPTPLFERVDDTPNEPPAHLQGKSEAEINKYWMDRERQIRAEQQPPNPPTPPVVTPPAPPPGMTAGQTNTLIQGAKLLSQQGKEHWQRFLPEVEGIMGQMTPQQQMDANMWNTVYEKVVGMHMNDLIKEARESALRPPSMESSNPPTPDTAPRQLTANELHVVDQLRRAGATAMRKDAQGVAHQVPFDAEAYITADKHRQEGKWPLTFNNF